jgi:hypothetical protein
MNIGPPDCRNQHLTGLLRPLLEYVGDPNDGRGCDEEYRTVYEYDELGRRTSSDPPLSDPTSFAYVADSSVPGMTT